MTYSDSELFWCLCNIISTESVIHCKHIIPANKSSFKHLGFSPRIKNIKLLVIFGRRWYHIRQYTPYFKVTLHPLTNLYRVHIHFQKQISRTFPKLFQDSDLFFQNSKFHLNPFHSQDFKLNYSYGMYTFLIMQILKTICWVKQISRTFQSWKMSK